MRTPDSPIEHWRREIESVDIRGRGTRRFRPAFRPAGRASPHDPIGYKGACNIGGAGSGAFTAIGRQYFLALVAKKIGRAHVSTPVTNAHLVCRLLLEKKKHTLKKSHSHYQDTK